MNVPKKGITLSPSSEPPYEQASVFCYPLLGPNSSPRNYHIEAVQLSFLESGWAETLKVLWIRDCLYHFEMKCFMDIAFMWLLSLVGPS